MITGRASLGRVGSALGGCAASSLRQQGTSMLSHCGKPVALQHRFFSIRFRGLPNRNRHDGEKGRHHPQKIVFADDKNDGVNSGGSGEDGGVGGRDRSDDDNSVGCALANGQMGKPVHGVYPTPSRPPPARLVRAFVIPGLYEADDIDEKDAPPGSPEGSSKGNAADATSKKASKDASAAKPPTSSSAVSASSGGKDGASADRGDGAEAKASGSSKTASASPRSGITPVMPEVVVRAKVQQNKRIKAMLMAALGSDFAQAGLHNDGVRTSFSVVNYQMLKQLTGLKSIPAKLLVSCLPAPDRSFTWIDISAHPTATLTEYRDSLLEVLDGLGIERNLIECCQEPMQLPQVTITKKCMCFLMRYAIEVPSNKRLDTFQDLTNRFTVFISNDRLVTVHRTQCTFVEELKVEWRDEVSESTYGKRGKRFVVYYCVKEAIATFTRAISKCIIEFDKYEANLFGTSHMRSSHAREIYHIKRRASVYGRALTLTQEAYTHMSSAMNVLADHVQYQEIMHDLSHVESLAEELNANADSLLQLLFQLSSYQVNELMRVLTVFSAFFIPLSFIAGVYGMNFENIPLLHWEHGELYCGALMVFVATSIFIWFKMNRFI